MVRKCNLWSFYLCLFCIILFFYSLSAEINDGWRIAPAHIILLLSIISFVLGIIGFQYKKELACEIKKLVDCTHFSTIIYSSFILHYYVSRIFSRDRRNAGVY